MELAPTKAASVAAATAGTEPDPWPGILTVGFGTAVAMWAVGYFARLPAVVAPSPLLAALLLACLVGGGVLLGRLDCATARHGAIAGALTGLLNLLVLGGLVSGERPNEIVPSALVWLPGSILASALLGALGAALGRGSVVGRSRRPDWRFVFAWVAIASLGLLLGVGGLVTSAGAGLAVADWPNSFGYGMFLYPLARMTGGIYYEHAHRLFGALVGLTALALALLLQARDPRRGVRRLAWIAWGMIVVQGILGGLRVTGGFTLSARPEALRPSLVLALLHGVLAQVLFGTMVVIGVLTSPGWRGGRPRTGHPAYVTDRRLGGLLIVLLLAQLVLGAVQRHLSALLVVHVIVGVAIVAPLALHVGVRTWGLHGERSRPLRWIGASLIGAVAVQVALGFGAFVATTVSDGAGATLAVATAHQWFGAVLLGLTIALQCWNYRFPTATVVTILEN